MKKQLVLDCLEARLDQALFLSLSLRSRKLVDRSLLSLSLRLSQFVDHSLPVKEERLFHKSQRAKRVVKEETQVYQFRCGRQEKKQIRKLSLILSLSLRSRPMMDQSLLPSFSLRSSHLVDQSLRLGLSLRLRQLVDQPLSS